MKNNRREFLKLTGIAGLAIGAGGFEPSDFVPLSLNQTDKEIKFISPVDGDMLNEYDGSLSDGNLIIKVMIKAPSGSSIKVNKLLCNSIEDTCLTV